MIMAKNQKPVLNLKSLETSIKEGEKATDEKIENLEKSLDKKMDDGFDKLFEKITSILPVQTSKGSKLSSDIHQHEDEHGIVFKEGTDPNKDVELVEVAMTSSESSEFKNKAEQLKFDSEMIEIMVMPSTSTYPDHCFPVGVNGRMLLVTRGKKQWLPRNYVEVLLRAKVSTYGNEETIRPNGERTIKNDETKAHRYPLQIIMDKNPKGAQWLQRVCNDMRA